MDAGRFGRGEVSRDGSGEELDAGKLWKLEAGRFDASPCLRTRRLHDLLVCMGTGRGEGLRLDAGKV